MTLVPAVELVVYEKGIPEFIEAEYDAWDMRLKILEKIFELYSDIK